MEQMMDFDANDAYAQVRQAITSLLDWGGADEREDVIYTANKLNAVLRMVADNYQTWSDDMLREFVLRQNDPLRNFEVKSDALSNKVREIQREMIVLFS